MAPQICIFEDDRVVQFLPLVFFRPVFELRCGMLSLQEKIFQAYPRSTVSIHCRTSLAPSLKVRNPQLLINEFPGSSCLFINGRLVADPGLAKKIPLTAKQDAVYCAGDQLVAASVSGKNLERIKKNLPSLLSLSDFDGVPKIEIEAEMVNYPWDVIQKNGTQIVQDFEWMMKRTWNKRPRSMGKVYPGVSMLGKKNIMIDRGAVIKPGTVLDAENGPIYIGRDVKVFPQCTIIGPVGILEGASIKVGAQIYENTTIGPVCKIGGEVERINYSRLFQQTARWLPWPCVLG